MKQVLVLHGVNLNMLGQRDAAQYGTLTLDQINRALEALAVELGVEVECFQSNQEGIMVDKIHQAHRRGTEAVVINAGAWTHYAYALRDALDILTVPIIEVHLSNIHARESFRHHSLIAPVARGQIAGLGLQSYLLGLRAAVAMLDGSHD